MEDKLISFDTAKLAKEKGFDVSVNTYYDLSNVFTKDKQSLSEYTISLDYNSKTKYPQFKEKCYISRPTQSLLQKWLREKHNLHIMLNTSINTNGKATFYCNTIKFGKNLYKSMFRSKSLIYTYEEALELGLQEGLKLIK